MDYLIDWARMTQAEIRFYQSLGTEAEKARYWALRLVGRPYVLGKENPEIGTDCSGVLSFALWMLHYNVRTTAHRFAELIFTRDVEGGYQAERLKAVFFAKAGQYRHVSLQIGRGVVLDAWTETMPVMFKAVAPMIAYWENDGYEIAWREINWNKLKEVSDAGTEAWDVDPVLKLYRSVT